MTENSTTHCLNLGEDYNIIIKAFGYIQKHLMYIQDNPAKHEDYLSHGIASTLSEDARLAFDTINQMTTNANLIVDNEKKTQALKKCLWIKNTYNSTIGELGSKIFPSLIEQI